ncbi:MAG: CD1247 N-terminal domain-containing protein [Christensenellales bacterium]|jgi:DNA-directed RNA polymerase subunit delta
MQQIAQRAAYLKGLAQGMKLEGGDEQQRLLAQLVDLVGDLCEQVTALDQEHQNLEEYVQSIDEDLSALEGDLSLEGEQAAQAAVAGLQEDEEAVFDEADFIQAVCPHCHSRVLFDAEVFKGDEELICPQCHEPMDPAE